MKVLHKLFHHDHAAPISKPDGAFKDPPLTFNVNADPNPIDVFGFLGVKVKAKKPTVFLKTRKWHEARVKRRMERHPRLRKTKRNLQRYGMPASFVLSLLTMEPGPLMAYFEGMTDAEAASTAAAMADVAAEETEITFGPAAASQAPLFPSQAIMENEEFLDEFTAPYSRRALCTRGVGEART